MIENKHYKKNTATLLLVALFFCACSEQKKEENINLKASLNSVATQEMFNSQIIRTDSGRAVMQIKAPVIKIFDFDKENPHTLLPKGGELKKYDPKTGKPVFIRADWAKIEDKKNLYEGRGHVVMISKNGDTIKTSRIFWNKRTRKIYNHVKTSIIRANNDSLIAEKGLEADDQFKNVKLHDTKTYTKNAELK